jgi:ABC-type uncharacterized transport system substrate-binding protein
MSFLKHARAIRRAWRGLPLWCALACSWGADTGPAITVLTSSGVDAYTEALNGLRAGLGPAAQTLEVVDVEAKSGEAELVRVLSARQARFIVTVGGAAASALGTRRVAGPIFRTMILSSSGHSTGPTGEAVTTVALNVPATALCARLKEAFPGKTRLAILGGMPAAGADLPQLAAEARQQGFTVRVLECAGPEKLLDAFAALKGQVDFVWCLPDSSLFNATTVKPLIMASLENRLPIIGFSESFLRAGAAVAVFPDFRDIGMQTADLIKRYLQGQKVPALEGPRTLRMGINQRVLRLVGMRHAGAGSPSDLVIVR